MNRTAITANVTHRVHATRSAGAAHASHVPDAARMTYSIRTIAANVRLLAFAFAVLSLMALAAPPAAQAEETGPFVVEGPADSYQYADSTLVISGEGVTIKGMDGLGRGGRNVHIEQGVSQVTFGSGVEIDTLSDDHSTTFQLEGENNSIAKLVNERDTMFRGTGSIMIGISMVPIEVYGGTVTVGSQAMGITVWQGGALVLEPGAQMGTLSQFGGTLDLSRLSESAPAQMIGYSIGGEPVVTSVIVPFGTADLNDLVAASNRFINPGTINAYSNGELVGIVQSTGEIYYTATRTVIFTGYDGRVLKTEDVRLFQSAEAPEVPEEPGYRFTGWDREFGRVSEDMTVAALFEPLAPKPDNPSDNPSGQPSDNPSDHPSENLPSNPVSGSVDTTPNKQPLSSGAGSQAPIEGSVRSQTGLPAAGDALAPALFAAGAIAAAAGAAILFSRLNR